MNLDKWFVKGNWHKVEVWLGRNSLPWWKQNEPVLGRRRYAERRRSDIFAHGWRRHADSQRRVLHDAGRYA